jgi:uncharacterized membrane protein
MTPRKLKWLLIGSLVLNLLLVATFVGGWLLRGSEGYGGAWRSFDRFVAMVPEEGRPAAQAVVDGYADQVAQARADVTAAREAVDAALSAETFDRAAAERAFDELDRRTTVMIDLVQSVILDLSARVPPDVRGRFLDRPQR